MSIKYKLLIKYLWNIGYRDRKIFFKSFGNKKSQLDIALKNLLSFDDKKKLARITLKKGKMCEL